MVAAISATGSAIEIERKLRAGTAVVQDGRKTPAFTPPSIAAPSAGLTRPSVVNRAMIASLSASVRLARGTIQVLESLIASSVIP